MKAPCDAGPTHENTAVAWSRPRGPITISGARGTWASSLALDHYHSARSMAGATAVLPIVRVVVVTVSQMGTPHGVLQTLERKRKTRAYSDHYDAVLEFSYARTSCCSPRSPRHSRGGVTPSPKQARPVAKPRRKIPCAHTRSANSRALTLCR